MTLNSQPTGSAKSKAPFPEPKLMKRGTIAALTGDFGGSGEPDFGS